jgi:hypothetical protein
MYFFARKYTPTNLAENLIARKATNSPSAVRMRGTETFVPPTMKNTGVIIAYATVRSRLRTRFVSELSMKCFDINSPKRNAGSTA